MKKGDRVQSYSVGGHYAIVLKVHRKSKESTVLFGVADNRKVTKRLPWSDLYMTHTIHTAEIPQSATEETSEREVPDLQEGRVREVDVRDLDPRDAPTAW